MKSSNTFTIYNASAGSGKTYTLVKDYLLLLFTSHKLDGFKDILAITFTNKAVAEMKSRIIESLAALSKEKPSAKEKNLQIDLAAAANMPVEVVQQKSKRLLHHLVNNYAAFEVSTIDGFTHRVLRTFAKDLGLPLNFEVELNTDEVLLQAVDRLISKAGEDKALTKVLINFVLSKTDDDKSWDVSRDLFKIAKLLLEEESKPFLDLLKAKSLPDFKTFQKEILEQIKNRKQNLNTVATHFFRLLEDRDLKPTDFSGGYCPGFFAKLQKGDFSESFGKKWQENLEDKALYPQKTDASKKPILDEIQPQVFLLFSEAKKQLLYLQVLEAVEKNLVPLSLLSAIQDEVEKIKQENAKILISDFNPTIGKAVKNQPAPFIYERLGERYAHFFIDEFQDTSQMQWENLIPLVDNTLGSEHEGMQHGSLTLVGDAKQSIYRWRGGKAEQFMELCNGQHPFSIEEVKMQVLPKNYRSARSIVNFNNNFFEYAASSFLKEEHRDLFLNSSQEPVSQWEGYVNISFVDAETADEELEAYPRQVLKIISATRQSGRPLSDICILTRSCNEGVVIANFLSEHEISVISAETLLVSRSPKVAFITSVLYACIDPDDRTRKFEILEFLAPKVAPENEFRFVREHLPLEREAFFESFKTFGIHFSSEAAVSMSVYEMVEYIIRSFLLGDSADAYLQFYLDFVHENTNTERAGIFAFLDIWEAKKDKLSIVVPQGEDAVQIMTIHKAKGLEFPVVIYPFVHKPIADTRRDQIWTQLPAELNLQLEIGYLQASGKMEQWPGDMPQLYHELKCNNQLDALNVLYVAMTRPEQQLYVISKMDLNADGVEKPNTLSGLIIGFLKSIGKWDGSYEYEFGNRHENIFEERPAKNSIFARHFYSTPTQSNGISIITRSGSMWNSKQQAAIEKGELIHDLFAQISTTSDIERVLVNGISEGLFSFEEKEELQQVIAEVTQHPQLQQYFAPTSISKTESDILTPGGNILRPDRINFSDKGVTVIDYKTGVPNTAHGQQLALYAQTLEEMGYSVENQVLIYINTPIVVRVL